MHFKLFIFKNNTLNPECYNHFSQIYIHTQARIQKTGKIAELSGKFKYPSTVKAVLMTPCSHW